MYNAEAQFSLVQLSKNINNARKALAKVSQKISDDNGGAGIGSVANGSGGDIVISGVNITANVYDGATIGSGKNGSIGNITIVNADITSNNVDTGIGSGEASSCGDTFVSNSDITGTSDVGTCIGTGGSSATAGNITVINETKVKHNCPNAATIGFGQNSILTGKINYPDSIGALEYALDQATNMGAYLQRLEATDANVTTMGENVQNSESTIRDADMAKEMSEYTRANILSQAAQAMLAQANQNSSSVLNLLS